MARNITAEAEAHIGLGSNANFNAKVMVCQFSMRAIFLHFCVIWI
jgi:hypothetical protein